MGQRGGIGYCTLQPEKITENGYVEEKRVLPFNERKGRKKIRLIKCNTKCHNLTKLTCKGLCRRRPRTERQQAAKDKTGIGKAV